MKLLAAQLNPIVGDLKGNRDKILHAIEHGREAGAHLVVTSELALCGYPPRDLLLHQGFVEEMEAHLAQLGKACRGIFAVVGLARRMGGTLRNSAALLGEGKILGYYDKQLLPTYDVFNEKRYFTPGSENVVWQIAGQRVGVLICEDIWYHAGETEGVRYEIDPVADLANEKLDLLINLSASPYRIGRGATRERVATQAALAVKVPLLLVCQVGGNDDLLFDGYSLFVDAAGQLRQQAAGFSEELMLVETDAAVKKLPVREEMSDLYQALVLGLRDYCHKQGQEKVCLGVSGGVDSALVAAIAAEAVGKENLLGIMLPSWITSQQSLDDARELAKRIGFRLEEAVITPTYASVIDTLEPMVGHQGDQWEEMGVTEENLQARLRALLLMALSNKLDYLLLATSNKSELAVGYCTLYGDLCGAMAPIADLFKVKVYQLCHWLNRERQLIPQSILERPATAELRVGQVDEQDLPPYALMDRILEGYIEKFLSLEEIVATTGASYDLVLQIARRVQRAEFKRRQSPPGVRVSPRALHVGRRYPIVQKWP